MLFHTTLTLFAGATVVIVENFAAPETLLDAIAEFRIDTVAAIAVSWSRMLDVITREPDRDVASITRAYAMWQSASSSEVYEAWRHRGIELQNNFGATSFCSWILAPRGPAPRASLGRAVPGYEVLAVRVDDDGQVIALPPGTPGQLATRGPTGLTYWNRPDLQRRDVKQGWTLADDMVVFDEDGNATYLGRTDFLISTAGHKVSPVEVEEVLSQHPAIREVGVIGGPDSIRHEVVTAYVVLQPGVIASDELTIELKNFVKQRLAPYKYPRRISYIEALPRDPVGKLQQGILKSWASTPSGDQP